MESYSEKNVNQLRFNRIVVMSLWPRFWPTLYTWWMA